MLGFGLAWSAGGATTTLVATGSVWRYLDNGSNQGTNWLTPTFDDSAWASGPGQLGYGDGDEATTVGFGSNANNKYITTYYRRSFFVPSAADISTLTARLQRDDGAVVYLNGMEVWRNNMPTGTITNLTLASSTVSGTNETNWVTATLNPAALFNGTNVLAVEIHQDATNSSDIAFDFELNASAIIHASPSLTVSPATGTLTFTWPAGAAWFSLRSATNLAPPVNWIPVTNSPSVVNSQWSVTLPAGTNGQRFFRLQTP